MDLESICDELFEDPQCIPDDIRDRIMMVCHGHGSTEVRFIGSLAQAEGGMKSYIELLVGNGGRPDPARSGGHKAGPGRYAGPQGERFDHQFDQPAHPAGLA